MPLPDEQLDIETPENIRFGYAIAGIGARFLAAVVDSLAILILQIIVTVVFTVLARGPLQALTGDNDAAFAWLLGLGVLLSMLFLWGYYIIFELTWNGQTPGKYWVGLRVVRLDGGPVGLVESLVRNLIRLVDFLPLFYGVGVVTMFADGRSRRLGDLAAGTLVVYTATSLTLESLLRQTPAGQPAPAGAASGGLPLERLTAQDWQLARSFAARRAGLKDAPYLARQVLTRLYQRMELPAEAIPPDDAEAALLALLASDPSQRPASPESRAGG